jgi:hypothetical protein
MNYRSKYFKYKYKYCKQKNVIKKLKNDLSIIYSKTNSNLVGGKYYKKKNMIPNIIHIIWFGKLPNDLEKKIKLWYNFNKGYKIWLWTSSKFKKNFENIKYEYLKIKLIESLPNSKLIKMWLSLSINKWSNMIYGAASDVARLSIITTHGGHYTDLDNYPGKINNNWGKEYGFYILKNKDLLPAFIGGKKNNLFTSISEEMLISKDYSPYIKLLINETKLKKWSFIAEIIGAVLNRTLYILKQIDKKYENHELYTIFLNSLSEDSRLEKGRIEIGSGLSLTNTEFEPTGYIKEIFYK